MGSVSWQQAMAQAITAPEELLDLLELPATLLPAAQIAALRFGLRVPRGFVALMERGNLADPLLRQILPSAAELQQVPGFHTDPVGDNAAITVPGVLAKYYGRVLLITSPVCAVHCRYCLRRNFPYQTQYIASENWQPALDSMRKNTTINEVILSGGDPLTLDDGKLATIIGDLASIAHIQRLRIHTRLPILIPQRVTEKLLALLTATRLTTVMVVHTNHPRELTATVAEALQNLRKVTIVLNQSVLLRGVNDNVATLVTLSDRLFATGTIPYYMHLLDRVQGTSHFEVTEAIAKKLLTSLRQRLPGYLVPRLVREEQGAAAKTIIM